MNYIADGRNKILEDSRETHASGLSSGEDGSTTANVGVSKTARLSLNCQPAH